MSAPEPATARRKLSDRPPLLSVVIPTLHEATTVGAILRDLRALTVSYEVVVADGGSMDETASIARAAGARVIRAPRGRGTQLRAGADAACAPLLVFLHADVRMDPVAAVRLSELALASPSGAWAFRLRIAADGLRFRFIEAGANARTRLFGLPYGDQGIVVRRGDYDRAGGFPPLPLMEDVAFARALRGTTDIRLLDAELVVSPRRWLRDGVLRRTLTNWVLLARYLFGASPERLVRGYRPEQRGG
jgi:rSAM/selenodomain-associated transferase 2